MRRLFAAFALLSVLASLPAQQLWLAQNDNTTYGNLAVGWPAAVLAFRFTAPQNATVVAAQIFTGNAAPAPHTLELRDHDAVTGLPGNLLGAPGTWTTLHARCWQGPTLPQPVALTAGSDYWLVWRVSGMFHQHSVSADGNPNNVITEVRVSDGSTWHAQAFLAAKFRLFTAYNAGPTFAFGTAKPGTHGNPQIGISGWPALGSPIDLWLDNAVRRQPALLLVGSPVPSGIPLPVGTAWTTGDYEFLMTTVTESSPFVGGATITLQVPNNPILTGVAAAFQWGIYDPVAVNSVAHTDAVALVIQ